MFRLWLRFCAVGVLGSVVQTTALYLARDLAGLHYLAATVLAVEITLAHNFTWHEHWTWKTAATPGWPRRAWRYQLGTGTVALLANLFAMRLLVGGMGLPTLVATPLAIGGSGVINFLIGQFLVFRRNSEPAAPKM
ncbi:MAG: GtrA family protein [Acidobacteria bacterium]|nr:GtrA family protein [Acidobacteriota bacterium]